MKGRRGLSAVLFVALQAAALGQAPLLRVSAPKVGPHGWQVTLTNIYTAPATAYWVDLTGGGPPGLPPNRPLARHWTDAVPGPANYRLAIAPGGSRVLPMGNRNWRDIVYINAAVIYSDGAAAGDPAIIARFERIRAAAAADLVQALALLSQAQADGTKRSALAQVFTARAAAHMSALQDGIAHVDDRVCRSAATNLARSDQDRAAGFEGLEAMFRARLSQLQAAAPVANSPAGALRKK